MARIHYLGFFQFFQFSGKVVILSDIMSLKNIRKIQLVLQVKLTSFGTHFKTGCRLHCTNISQFHLPFNLIFF